MMCFDRVRRQAAQLIPYYRRLHSISLTDPLIFGFENLEAKQLKNEGRFSPGSGSCCHGLCHS
jgi:hypothetical protein